MRRPLAVRAATATEKQAVFDLLKERNPDFFNDAELRGVAWRVIRDCAPELGKLHPLDQFELVNKIMLLMSEMGRAGALATGMRSQSTMFSTFLTLQDEWRAKRKGGG